jgi:methionyl-tRNA formyltransferase
MNKKLGLLCTIDGPLLRFFVESLLDAGYENIYLIADYRGFSKDDLSRFEDRTNNFFCSRKLTLGDFAGFKIPVFFVNSHNDEECIALISSIGIDLLLNVGTPRKLSKIFLQHIGCDVLNVHPGVLPDYRGASCVEWAILNDGPIGNSAHFMVEEYDAGPIIGVESYQFERGSSYSDIRTKIYICAIRLMTVSVGRVFEGGLSSQNLDTQKTDIEPYLPISSEDMLIVLERIKYNSHQAICLPQT